MIGLMTRTVPRYRLRQAFVLGLLWGLCLAVFVGDSYAGVVSSAPTPSNIDTRARVAMVSPPIYATSYNWELGGINCDGDCGRVASGLFTRPELLGVAAACPSAWVGRPRVAGGRIVSWHTVRIEFPEHPELGLRYCVDTFGASYNRQLFWLPVSFVRPVLGGLWVYRVDFAEKDPASFAYNQRLISPWRVERVAVPAEWYLDDFQVVGS